MTKIVAILNITPDSFSDGGENFVVDNALKSAASMIEAGIDVIDIGAESTRPGAKILDSDDEWNRLGPVLMEIIPMIRDTDIKISIDSYHYQTIEKSLHLGIDIVNDVSGCIDQNIIDIVASHGEVKMVLMHNLGVPANPKITIKSSENHIEVIKKWAEERIVHLRENGISDDQIIFDPGVGFGKTAEQSLDIIKNISKFKHLAKIMVGHSRKSFMSIFSKDKPSMRDIETYITSSYLSTHDVEYIRVHDFMGNKKAIMAAKYLW
jgi:dihydropteroate synthase